MNNRIRNKTVLMAVACTICFFFSGNTFSQDKVEVLEKRIISLEKRVRIMESRLDKALNPAKYSKQTEKPAIKAKRTGVTFIKSPIRARLIKKNLKMAEAGEVDDNIALLITFKNVGPEEIVSFKGDIVFRDVYADSILSFYAEIKKVIPAGLSNTWFGGFTYNAANGSHRKLLDKNVDRIDTELRPEVIVFSDGTIKSFKKK